jgi:hypothetical protein
MPPPAHQGRERRLTAGERRRRLLAHAAEGPSAELRQRRRETGRHAAARCLTCLHVQRTSVKVTLKPRCTFGESSSDNPRITMPPLRRLLCPNGQVSTKGHEGQIHPLHLCMAPSHPFACWPVGGSDVSSAPCGTRRTAQHNTPRYPRQVPLSHPYPHFLTHREISKLLLNLTCTARDSSFGFFPNSLSERPRRVDCGEW